MPLNLKIVYVPGDDEASLISSMPFSVYRHIVMAYIIWNTPTVVVSTKVHAQLATRNSHYILINKYRTWLYCNSYSSNVVGCNAPRTEEMKDVGTDMDKFRKHAVQDAMRHHYIDPTSYYLLARRGRFTTLSRDMGHETLQSLIT